MNIFTNSHEKISYLKITKMLCIFPKSLAHVILELVYAPPWWNISSAAKRNKEVSYDSIVYRTNITVTSVHSMKSFQLNHSLSFYKPKPPPSVIFMLVFLDFPHKSPLGQRNWSQFFFLTLKLNFPSNKTIAITIKRKQRKEELLHLNGM